MINSREELYIKSRNAFLQSGPGEVINNYRDLVIYLLWSKGLSFEEIRILKVNDIEFPNNNNPKAIINLPFRKITITELVMVYDLLKCIELKNYIKGYKYSMKEIPYLDSPYLIKQVPRKGRKAGEPVNISFLNSRLMRFLRIIHKAERKRREETVQELSDKLNGLKFHIETINQDLEKAVGRYIKLSVNAGKDSIFYQWILYYKGIEIGLDYKTKDGVKYVNALIDLGN